MEDPSDADDTLGADLSPNPVGLLQRRHTQPLRSHQTYLNPEVQPVYASEARGENPWTGQKSEEVREAAFSQQKYQQLQKESRAKPKESVPPNPPSSPTSPRKYDVGHVTELDEIMFATSS